MYQIISFTVDSALEEAREAVKTSQTLLGNRSCIKCVYDLEQEEDVFTRCVSQHLDSLLHQSPVRRLIQQVVQSHHARYGCSVKTLTTMIWCWATTFKNLCHEGVPRKHIIMCANMMLERCIEQLERISIPVDTVNYETTGIKTENQYNVDNILCTFSKDLSLFCNDREKSTNYKKGGTAVNDLEETDWFFDKEAEAVHDSSILEAIELSSNIVGGSQYSRALYSGLDPKFHKQCESTKKGDANDGVEWKVKESESDDEFESCFENTDFVLQDESSFKEVQIKTTKNEQMCANDTGDRNQHDLETLLNSKLQEKSEALKTMTQNQSRHFKTVESTIGEAMKVEHSEGLPSKVVMENCKVKVTEKLKEHTKSLYSRHLTSKIQEKVIVPFCEEKETMKHENGSIGFEEKIKSLGHGSDKEMMWAFSVWKYQTISTDEILMDKGIDVQRVHVCPLVGPNESNSCLVEGAVISVHIHQLELVARQQYEEARMVFVNGDVTHTFKHVGHKKTGHVTLVANRVEDLIPSHERWFRVVIQNLTKLGVNTILLRGVIDDKLRQWCYSNDVVIIDHVPYKVLQALASTCQVDAVTYIQDLSESDVAMDAVVSPWREDWMCSLNKMSCVKVTVPSSILQTLALCHPCTAVTRMQEEQFWHCVSRLNNAIKCGTLLPGKGVTEVFCADFLDQISVEDAQKNTSEETKFFYMEITQAFGHGFKLYKMLLDKHGQETEDLIYDDFLSKTEAWRSALYILSFILQTGNFIRTGIVE